MERLPPSAEPEDPVDDYEEEFERHTEQLALAATAITLIGMAHEESYNRCDTVAEAAEYVDERTKEMLSEEHRDALDDVLGAV